MAKLSQRVATAMITLNAISGVGTTNVTSLAGSTSSLAQYGLMDEVTLPAGAHLHWTLRSDSIKLAIDTPGIGWAAVGFGANMQDAIVVIGGGLKGGGQAAAGEVRAYGLSGYGSADVSENSWATSHLSEVEVLHEGGRTKVIFAWHLVHFQEAPTLDGQPQVIYAWNSGNGINYHGSKKGVVAVDFVSGAVVVDTTVQDRKATHGWLMLLGWGVLCPSGTLAAAYGGSHFQVGGKRAFNAHRALQSLGLVIAVASASFAMTQIYDASIGMTMHGVLGLLVTVLGVLQPINAILRPRGDAHPWKRLVWEYVHKILGRILTVVAFLLCLSGSKLGQQQHELESVFNTMFIITIALIVLFSLGYAMAKMYSCWKKKNAKVREIADAAEAVQPSQANVTNEAVGRIGG